MRSVFVTLRDDDYKVIDKATGKSEMIDDVLLFNAEYKRYNNEKGWHGIINEEINADVIKVMQFRFYEIKFEGKLYYPRVGGIPVKCVQFLKLRNGIMEVCGFNSDLEPYHIKKYTAPWVSYTQEDIDEDEEEEDVWDEDWDDAEEGDYENA